MAPQKYVILLDIAYSWVSSHKSGPEKWKQLPSEIWFMRAYHMPVYMTKIVGNTNGWLDFTYIYLEKFQLPFNPNGSSFNETRPIKTVIGHICKIMEWACFHKGSQPIRINLIGVLFYLARTMLHMLPSVCLSVCISHGSNSFSSDSSLVLMIETMRVVRVDYMTGLVYMTGRNSQIETQ